MTLLEFLHLTLKQKTVEVFERGTVLETEKVYDDTFLLYYLDNFFVEITMSQEQGIIDITPFKTGYRLEKYIDKINIDRTLNNIQ